MTELIFAFAGLVILIFMWVAYRRFRDPLHPVLVCGVFFLYMYSVRPLWMCAYSDIRYYFKSIDDLNFVGVVNLVGILAFCLGCIRGSRTSAYKLDERSFELDPEVLRKIYAIGVFFGAIALLAYLIPILQRGGFSRVYGHSKGYYFLGSGYISELPMLAFPAIVLMMLGRRNLGLQSKHVLTIAFTAMPHVIHGILGARRGPTFLIATLLIFGWPLISGRRLSISRVVVSLSITGLFLVFLVTNRSQIYIGSDFELNSTDFVENFLPTTVKPGDDVVYPCALIVTSRNSERHYWGGRLFMRLVVRIVPRFIWPSKYDDLGFGWMVGGGRMHGYKPEEWIAANGWRPSNGSAAGFIADAFVEMGYGFGLICFAIGLGYGMIWRRSVSNGGLWKLLYLIALILTVYLPTQSITALVYRFFLMSLPAIAIWHIQVGPIVKRIRWNRYRNTSRSIE